MVDVDPWSSAPLRAAWVARDFAAVFRQYGELTGRSQMEIGAAVGMPQSHVSLIRNGKRKVTSAEVIDRIAAGLKVPAELGGLPERRKGPIDWSPDPELNERVAHATERGRVDLRSADRIACALRDQRRAEDARQGPERWLVVRSQLDAVTGLLPSVSGAVADRLLLLSAEHAHWLSWVSHAEGKHGPSLAWLDQAHGWALDSGSADMRSWLARVRSRYILKRDPKRALRIAEVAVEGRGLTPAARSIAMHAESLAAAAVGERDRARQLADEAYGLALMAPDEDARPPWLYWLDPLRATLLRADTLYAARDWQGAAALYREAVGGLIGFPRDRAVYLTRLEDALRRS